MRRRCFARNTHRRFLDLYAHIVLKAHPAPPDRAAIRRHGGLRSALRQALDVPYEAQSAARAAPCAPCSNRWNSPPRAALSAAPRHPRRSRHGGDGSGDGVRQSRRALRHRRSFLPQSADRRAGALRRIPSAGAGRGRRVGQVYAGAAVGARERVARGPCDACSPPRRPSNAPDVTFRTSSSPSSADSSSSCSPARRSLLRTRQPVSRSISCETGSSTRTPPSRRITPDQVRILLAPHISPQALHGAQLSHPAKGASPGVGIGVLVSDSDEAERRAHARRGRHSCAPDHEPGRPARHDRLRAPSSPSRAAAPRMPPWSVARWACPASSAAEGARSHGLAGRTGHGRRPDRQGLRRRAADRGARRKRP